VILFEANTTTTDLGFLSELTTKPPLNYIAFCLIGLYSSISFVCIEEKRLPNWFDFLKLFGYVPFVGGLALLIGTSPLISLFIGIAPELAFKFVKRRAKKWFKSEFDSDSDKETGDDDDDNNDRGKGKGNGPKQE
jgi:amino acid transporter